jgi:hypothetical protein
VAQKIQTVLIDDLTGETSDEIDVATVEFALDGASYEIDLGEANATKLREQFAPYLAAARRTGKVRQSGPAAPQKPRRRDVTTETTMTREMSQAAREWARSQGYTVPRRGRLPGHLAHAYREHLATL